MGKRSNGFVAIFALILITGCKSITDFHCLISSRFSMSRREISKIIKQSVVSVDTPHTLDLNSIFLQDIDSVFYCNGPMSSSEIIRITNWRGVVDCSMSSVQDNQSRIILFSNGKTCYYESFDIPNYFFIIPVNSYVITQETIIEVNKNKRGQYQIIPMASHE